MPIANEKKVLLFGTYSGADLLRKTPPDRYVINLRASYAEETGVMVRGLFRRGIKPQEIAFFTQNDAYGDSGFNGAVQALNEAGFHDTKSLAHGRYDRGTIAVESGVMALVEARVRPKAVILVGTYAANARFIRLARQLYPIGVVPERVVCRLGRAQPGAGRRRRRRDRRPGRAALRLAVAGRARVPGGARQVRAGRAGRRSSNSRATWRPRPWSKACAGRRRTSRASG